MQLLTHSTSYIWPPLYLEHGQMWYTIIEIKWKFEGIHVVCYIGNVILTHFTNGFHFMAWFIYKHTLPVYRFDLVMNDFREINIVPWISHDYYIWFQHIVLHGIFKPVFDASAFADAHQDVYIAHHSTPVSIYVFAITQIGQTNRERLETHYL